MTGSVSRTYSGAADRQALLDLLVAVRPAERITDYPGMVDLRELLALGRVQENTRLWLGAAGRVVGFALVDPYNNLHFEIDRPAAHPAVETEMVAWGVACIRRQLAASDEVGTLDTSAREDDAGRIALLERHGFVRQAGGSLHLVRALDMPIPRPEIPAGFAIRPVAGEQEVPALVALHRAAFGTANMTVEERLAMMRVPEYDSELDLLAVAPDGRLAAYCFCSISQEENQRSGRNEGYTDPIATHPDFQRRGLARALLLTGLHKLKQRGVAAAVLGTSSENVPMQRSALAVGFRIQSATLWFTKDVLREDPATR